MGWRRGVGRIGGVLGRGDAFGGWRLGRGGRLLLGLVLGGVRQYDVSIFGLGIYLSPAKQH